MMREMMGIDTFGKGAAKTAIMLFVRARWLLRTKRPFDPSSVRSILIPAFYPIGLGDLLMDTPALRALRGRFPEARITLVTDSSVLDGNPNVDEIVRIGRRPFAYRKLLSKMRGRHDLVLLLNKNPLQSLFALAVGKGHIVGYVDGWRPKADFPVPGRRERFARSFSPKDHFYDMGIRVARLLGAEEPTRNLDPVAFGEKELRQVQKLLGKKVAGKMLVIISPKVLWESRTWPSARYQELMKHLLADGCAIAVIGGPDDKEYNAALCGRFSSDRRLIDLTGRTSLQELAALLSLADLAVMGDCGPMHVAIGARCPLLTLWGPTDPATRLPPARVGKDIVALYHPEHPDAASYRMEHDPGGRAIDAITVEEAYAAASTLLDQRKMKKGLKERKKENGQRGLGSGRMGRRGTRTGRKGGTTGKMQRKVGHA